MSRLSRTIARCAATVCVAASTLPALAQTYNITDLGPAVLPNGINAAGTITGSVGTRAFVYNAGTMTDLGTLGGTVAVGQAINSSNWVTGYSTRADGSYRAFVWSAGSMVELPTLGAPYGVGYGLNDLGQVVGSSQTASHLTHAFLASNGQLFDLGTLGGNQVGWTTTAAGINGAGQVVGYSYLPSGDFHAFLYSAGAMADLGTLGGDWSQAWAINASGQITGQAYLPGNVSAHAFLYSGGTMKDLGALYQYSTGRAINSAGLVVGSANVRSASTLMVYHAVLFRRTGPVDLNRLIPARSGWVLSEATGVNDSGQIVGYGSFHGVDHGFLLTPR